MKTMINALLALMLLIPFYACDSRHASSDPGLANELDRGVRAQERSEEERRERQRQIDTPAPSATPEAAMEASSEGAEAGPIVVDSARDEAISDEVRRLSMRAMLLERRGDDADALIAYEAALKLQPTSTYVLSRVARLRLAVGGRDPAALEAARRAVELDPTDPELHMTLAACYDQVGDSTRAQAALERVIELSPGDTNARLRLAEDYFNRGRYDRAAHWLEELVQSNPERLQLRHQLGLAYMRMDRYDDAIEELNAVLEKFPNRDTYMAVGECLEKKGEIAEAVRRYSWMAQSRKDDVESRRRLGRLLVEHGLAADRKVAINWWEDVLRLVPGDEEALRMLSLLHFTLRQYHDAEERMDQLLAAHPESEEAQRLAREIGVTLLRNVKDATAAARYFEKIGEASPGDPRAAVGLALSHLEIGDTDKATAEFEALAARSPELLQPRLNLIELYQRERRWDAMLPHLDAALGIVARHSATSETAPLQRFALLHMKSISLARLDRFGEATPLVEEMLILQPTSEEAVMMKAELLERQDRFGEVESLVRAYLGSNPDSPQALNFLGYTYAERSMNLEEAEKMIRRALTIEPGQGQYIDSLGWVLHKRGQHEEAVRELERAAELEPDPVIIDHLADAYLAADMPEKAREKWEHVLQLEPSNKEVQAKLDKLKKDTPQRTQP